MLLDGYWFSHSALTAAVAEATAILAVVSLSNHRGLYGRAYFESDALFIINTLNNGNAHCPWKFQAIVNDIKALVGTTYEFVFCCVIRHANRAAD